MQENDSGDLAAPRRSTIPRAVNQENMNSIQQAPSVAIELSTKMARQVVGNIQVPLSDRSPQGSEDVDEVGGVYLGPFPMVDKTAGKIHFYKEDTQITVALVNGFLTHFFYNKG